MPFDISSLRPAIRQILTAPGTDLSTISAKRVRKQLPDVFSGLNPEELKENKDSVDALIGSVFEEVSAEADIKPADAQEEHASASGSKRGRTDEEEQEAEPKKKKKSASKTEVSDAEYARRLQSELNGHSTRGGGGSAARAKPHTNGTRKPKKKAKSAATIDSDEDGDSELEDEGASSSKKKRKTKSGGGGGGAKGGFAKEFVLSEPLSSMLQVSKLSRPQTVKQIWVYIKANELQNPSNKRQILCDEPMRRVFGDKVDMFQMNKLLGSHLHEPDE